MLAYLTSRRARFIAGVVSGAESTPNVAPFANVPSSADLPDQHLKNPFRGTWSVSFDHQIMLPIPALLRLPDGETISPPDFSLASSATTHR
ncbi:MAG: hypothetical protein QOK10_1156 [Pseudonocardiales bacterium]|jgi:hypothetical protein|nr:hypothetical protein [Pseudonocardiales bacterium]